MTAEVKTADQAETSESNIDVQGLFRSDIRATAHDLWRLADGKVPAVVLTGPAAVVVAMTALEATERTVRFAFVYNDDDPVALPYEDQSPNGEDPADVHVLLGPPQDDEQWERLRSWVSLDSRQRYKDSEAWVEYLSHLDDFPSRPTYGGVLLVCPRAKNVRQAQKWLGASTVVRVTGDYDPVNLMRTGLRGSVTDSERIQLTPRAAQTVCAVAADLLGDSPQPAGILATFAMLLKVQRDIHAEWFGFR